MTEIPPPNELLKLAYPQVKMIGLSLLDPDLIRSVDGKTVTELRESIKKYGVLQPLLVRPVGRRYKIVYGNHRYYAAKGAGLKFLPCVVKDLSVRDSLYLALTENLQRLEMNPVDAGKVFSQLKDEGVGPKEIASKIGKSEYYVTTRIQVYQGLCPELRPKVGEAMSIQNAYRLSRLPQKTQLEVYENIMVYKQKTDALIKPQTHGGLGVGGGNMVWKASELCICPRCGAEHPKPPRRRSE